MVCDFKHIVCTFWCTWVIVTTLHGRNNIKIITPYISNNLMSCCRKVEDLLITKCNPVLCLKWLQFTYVNALHLHTFLRAVEPNVINPIYVFPQLKLTTRYNSQASALMLTVRLKLSSSAYLKQATSKCIFLLRQKQLLRYNMSVYIPNLAVL
jgi:hypothetical protein